MTFKNSASASQGAMDMLEGGVLRKLLVFAIPLIASGVLQQSFNAVDIAVVGRFASSQALAAVGGNNVVINILVNLFVGVSIGANVVAANYIGRRNEAGVRRTVGSAAALALLSGFLLTILGQLLVHPILVAMSTPGDVLPLASLYLRLFFIGMPFVMVFNFGASLLRSIGDTRRPLYMLIVAGIVNTVLNLLLVVGLDMSVAGVAIATVIAQGLSAAMMVRTLLRETSEVKLNLREIRLSRSEVVKMLRIGVPAGLQGMIFSFANIFVQTTINGFGSAAVAGSSASLNFESYSYFVISAFSQAAVSFISQNYGAGRYDRCVEVFRKSMFLALVSSSVLNLSMVFFREPLASLFSSDPEVLSYACERMLTVLLFQFVACSYEVAGGAMRGLGYSMTPTIVTVVGTCLLRLGWIFAVFPAYGTFRSLLVVYPVSWVVTGIVMLVAWHVVRSKRLTAVVAISG